MPQTQHFEIGGNLPALLTIPQACHQLQVARTQLYGFCKTGALRPVTIGKRGVRIPRCEIERFIVERM